MGETHKSSSIEQMQAEDIVFEHVQSMIQEKLERNKKIYLKDNAFTYIQPDFYSKEADIVGEIFVHIGKPKKAQDNKIANDILKMLLLDKIHGKTYRKMLIVCDKEEEKKLKGLSALAESIRQFNVEVKYVDLDENTRKRVLAAQQRQKMINA